LISIISSLIFVMVTTTPIADGYGGGGGGGKKPDERVCGDRLCTEVDRDKEREKILQQIAVATETIDPSPELKSQIPDWVKKVTLWWGEEEISDEEFVRAIEFLIENKILLVDDYEKDEINFLNGEKAYELAKILQLETQAYLPFESVMNIAVVGDIGTNKNSLKTLKNIEAADS